MMGVNNIDKFNSISFFLFWVDLSKQCPVSAQFERQAEVLRNGQSFSDDFDLQEYLISYDEPKRIFRPGTFQIVQSRDP